MVKTRGVIHDCTSFRSTADKYYCLVLLYFHTPYKNIPFFLINSLYFFSSVTNHVSYLWYKLQQTSKSEETYPTTAFGYCEDVKGWKLEKKKEGKNIMGDLKQRR